MTTVVNCYDDDWGYQQILQQIGNFVANCNLVLASLGPKTSAIALYRLHRNLPEISLVYSPCKNYNQNYSIGIGSTLSLHWEGSIADPPLPERLAR